MGKSKKVAKKVMDSPTASLRDAVENQLFVATPVPTREEPGQGIINYSTKKS